MERERKEREFRWISENAPPNGEGGDVAGEGPEAVESRTRMFEKLLEVPREERDRVQRLQVIDRAAAAIAATKALLKDLPKGDVRRGAAGSGDDGGRSVEESVGQNGARGTCSANCLSLFCYIVVFSSYS